MSDTFYLGLDKVNAEITEKNIRTLAHIQPNTFSILYREGGETSKIEYSEYFLEELMRRSNNSITDITDANEIDVRTSSYTYELYLERNLHKTRDELRNETRADLRKILAPDHRDEENLKILENVPNYMKESFTIVNYPKWGEVIEFDYDKLKAEMLDEYMKTGSKDKLDESYKILLQDMEKFPNLYKIQKHRILEVFQAMPYEIMEKERLHREYCLQLSQSPEYAEIRLKIYNLRESRPDPTENATREQYEEWCSTVFKQWEDMAKQLWDTIPEKYKTAFNMKLDSRGIHIYFW